MVRYMQEHFNSRPEELVAAIGPSICVDCYEVSEEVAEQFRGSFPEDVLQPGKAPGKYQLDLWKANQSILVKGGDPAGTYGGNERLYLPQSGVSVFPPGKSRTEGKIWRHF